MGLSQSCLSHYPPYLIRWVSALSRGDLLKTNADRLRWCRSRLKEVPRRRQLAEGDFRVSSKKWLWKSFRAHIPMLCSRTAESVQTTGSTS